MESILGFILGALIIVAVLAWSVRHPSPRRPRNESWHGFEATGGGTEYGSNHITNHGEGSSHGGSLDV